MLKRQSDLQSILVYIGISILGKGTMVYTLADIYYLDRMLCCRYFF